MKQVLVTGGAGFIGSHVTRALVQRGTQVRVFDDLSTGYRANLAEVANDVEFVEGSITDAAAVAQAARNCECIFHLAARASVPRSVADPAGTHMVNVTGTLNVLEAARTNDVPRLVYSASSSAYGEIAESPKRETLPPQPLSPYAVSKLAGEHYCQAYAECYGLQTVALRYFNVFGPGQDPKSDYAAVIPAFVTRMLAGERPLIYGDGEQSRDFCYIENVVNANLLAATAPEARGVVVNIACGQSTTLNEIVTSLNTELGTGLEADYQPARAGDVRHSLAALDAAKSAINYEPKVFFAEGLSRSIAWYRDHPTGTNAN